MRLCETLAESLSFFCWLHFFVVILPGISKMLREKFKTKFADDY